MKKMNKNNIAYVGIILAVVLSTLSLFKAPAQGPSGKDGKDGQTYGSQVGPDTYFPYETHNGVGFQFISSNFSQGTSTLCVSDVVTATSTFRFTAQPTSATSTSVLAVLEARSSHYAPNLSAASSTTNYFTAYTIPANSTNAFSTSTPTDSVNANTSINGTLTPGQRLVFYAKNGGNGSISQNFGSGSIFTGRCRGEIYAL